MELRPMMSEDIAFVAEHTVSRGVFGKQPDTLAWSYALEHDGTILGVGGIQLIVPGTAWAWVDITRFGLRYIKTGYRTIREWMARLTEEHNIHRLQAYVDLEFPEAVRMIEHLGFTRESIMWDFLGDKPAALYVIIYRKES